MRRIQVYTGLLAGILCAAILAAPLLVAPKVSAQGYTKDSTAITKTVTLTAASYSTAARYIQSIVNLSPTGHTVAITGSQSIAATSGESHITTGNTFTDGFLYGTRGKSYIAGTVNEASAARVVGVIGQIDSTGGTLTAGQISGVWADLQGNAGNAETYPLRVSNSSSVTTIPALAFFVGRAAAAFSVSDLGNGSSGDFVVNTSGTSAGQCAQTGGLVATKALKIVADGTNYWLPLCTAP